MAVSMILLLVPLGVAMILAVTAPSAAHRSRSRRYAAQGVRKETQGPRHARTRC